MATAIQDDDPDSGDDDPPLTDLGITYTATFAEIVTIGGIGYVVSAGSIDVGGDYFNVPTANSVVTTNFGSYEGTLYPAFTGQYVSITATYLTPVPFSTTTPSSPPPPTTTQTPTPTPTSSPPPPPPQATCSIQGAIDSESVSIWTNYINDGGSALRNAIEETCASLDPSNWLLSGSTNVYTDDNGVAWQATSDVTFKLELARAAAQLECVNVGIGNSIDGVNNPTCDFTPASG